LHSSFAEQPTGALRHTEVEARHHYVGQCYDQQEQSPVARPDSQPGYNDACQSVEHTDAKVQSQSPSVWPHVLQHCQNNSLIYLITYLLTP
jgi:hypothetical protein